MISDEQLKRLTARYDIGNVPGYLSYPAVAKWTQPLSDADVHSVFDHYAASGDNDAYLYFHWPYCESLCYYCACYMSVTADPKTRYDEYVAAMGRELALKVDRLPQAKLRVGDMHWGGGTPTYMSCEQIERAYTEIDKRVTWSPNASRSIEAYPDERTLSDEKVELLASLGFNEISFGIESLDPKVLEAINRRHSLDSIKHWVDKARKHGFGVHVDLVYGLPYQDAKSFGDTVAAVLEIAPDRLATFSFMYTPLQIKHQRAIPRQAVPNSDARFRLFEMLEQVVETSGYTRVGVDHWVKGEKDPIQRAHRDVIYGFQGYEPLSRQTFLGFGTSAISFAQGRYFQNATSVNDYVRALQEGRLPTRPDVSWSLSPDDRIRHRLILKDVMSDLRIDKDAVERLHGLTFDTYFADALARLRPMEADGLVRGVGGRVIEVTETGRAFVRNIANAFDAYYPAVNPQLTELAS